jgi:hypothetical protein
MLTLKHPIDQDNMKLFNTICDLHIKKHSDHLGFLFSNCDDKSELFFRLQTIYHGYLSYFMVDFIHAYGGEMWIEQFQDTRAAFHALEPHCNKEALNEFRVYGMRLAEREMYVSCHYMGCEWPFLEHPRGIIML